MNYPRVTRGRKKLQPLKEGEKDQVLALLEDSLASPRLQAANETVKELLKKNAAQDIGDLIPHLELRAQVLAENVGSVLQKISGAAKTRQVSTQ